MSNLDFDFVDDMNVGVDPDTYPDQANPAPVPSGNYQLRITKFDVARTKDGKAVVFNNTEGKPAYPVFNIEQAEILEPAEFRGRKIGLFQQVSTRPFARQGDPSVTQMGDLLRALDQTVNARGTKAVVDEVMDRVGSTPISVRLDWEANDFGFIGQKFEELFGGKRYSQLDAGDKNVANGIYKQAKCVGMKNFPDTKDGKKNHVWTGPSGDQFEARAKITRYYPSLADVKYRTA